ncbi:MAG: replication-relaxation family protein [Bryobacteraceae bacterium]
MVLQERDRRLLEALGDQMDVVDREQTKVVTGIRSTSRMNERLLKLTRAGFLKRVFIGGNQAVYALAHRKNRSSNQPATGEPLLLFCRHQLEINAVYLALTYRPLPESVRYLRFRRFREILAPSVPLIPDAYFELEFRGAVRPMFLEVDLGTESLPVWQRKTREYLQLALSGEFPKLFSQTRFGVLVVTTTPRRLEHLRAEIARATQKIFYLTTPEAIHAEGLWAAVWWRPSGDQPQKLI